MQFPEGFRRDPDTRWDDEIKRLIEAAGAFERVANVVQSTLLELCYPLEYISLWVLRGPIRTTRSTAGFGTVMRSLR